MVSVIIPVYETEKYLAQCLESVITQTFSDLEIILVVAKSNDKSESICQEYSKVDSRILVVEQDGNGAGNARNQGVEVSRGDYICFVDSDDWVEPEFIEKLLNAMISHDSEIVECDNYWTLNDITRIEGNSLLASIDDRLIRILGSPACWKLMYKRSFWDRERLSFSNTVAEDLYLYSYIYRVSQAFFFVREPLYHYRIREGGFTDTAVRSIDKYRELLEVFLRIIDQYKKRGLWILWHNELYHQLIPHACNRYRVLKKLISQEESQCVANETIDLFFNQFNRAITPFNRKVVVLGSYNLSRIGNFFTTELAREVGYGFSSLISIFSEKGNIVVKGKNAFRQIMLDKEISRQFVREMTCSMPDLLLIDLVEERHDIIKHNECFYTLSDALVESEYCVENAKTIKRESDECNTLWRASCDKLVDMIEGVGDNCKVILIENYLSEYVGNMYYKEKYDDTTIKKINDKLREYYEYFEKKCNNMTVIKKESIPDSLYYTEKDFEYGTTPEHLNNNYYCFVADRIAELMEKEK